MTTEDTEGTERATPETDAAVKASNGQWSFVLKETCQRLERERDEAREHLREIKEYGTEEINAAVDPRQKLAAALIERDKAREDATNFYAKIGELECERDEARALVDRLHVAFEGRCRAAYEWYSTEASDVREAALRFLYPEQFK